MGTNMSRGLMTSEELLEQTLRTRAEARLAFSHDPAESFGALTHRRHVQGGARHGVARTRPRPPPEATGGGPHGAVNGTADRSGGNEDLYHEVSQKGQARHRFTPCWCSHIVKITKVSNYNAPHYSSQREVCAVAV